MSPKEHSGGSSPPVPLQGRQSSLGNASQQKTQENPHRARNAGILHERIRTALHPRRSLPRLGSTRELVCRSSALTEVETKAELTHTAFCSGLANALETDNPPPKLLQPSLASPLAGWTASKILWKPGKPPLRTRLHSSSLKMTSKSSWGYFRVFKSLETACVLLSTEFSC